MSFDPEAGGDYTDRRSLWDTPQRWNASGPAYCLSRLHVQFKRRGGALDPLNVDDCLHTLWGGLARIADLAADAGVHPTYFTRAFRKRFGLGPAEYRNRLRVTAACRALAGRESLQSIVMALGYADQPHFTRDFQQRIGTTPAAYRAALAK